MKRLIGKIYILSIFKNETFTQAAKYFIVGGFCTVLDFAMLFVLTHFAGLNYVTSSIISFMSGTVLNYYLCTFWIFKVRVVENRHYEFFYYAIITAIGLGINTLLIWSFTEFIGLYFMLSKLLATFVTYWWNFGARKYFLHTIK
jgi:putative flippase GtrA